MIKLLQLKNAAATHLAPSGFRVVLQQEKHGYDEARAISNSRFDLKPLAVAFPRAAEHVVQCIRFCQDNNIELRVRSGGHQHEGMCSGDGVLVVRLSEMNQIQWTDGTRQTAWIQVGARLEDVYRELASYGKIIPGGGCKGVNVGGLTLGGGWGLSARKFGLACDNVLEVEVVLADGRIVRATKDNEYHDLFWALLGSGGGNFGIVTRFRFRLHDISPALSSYKVYWQASQREEVIRRWLRYQRSEQSENTTSYLLLFADLKDGFSYSRPPVYAGGKSYCEKKDLMEEVYGWTQDIQPAKGPDFDTQKPRYESLGSGAGAFEIDERFPGWLQADHEIEHLEGSVSNALGDASCRAEYPTENCLAPYPHKVTSAFPVDCEGSIEDDEAKLARVISKYIAQHPVDRYVKSYISLYSMGGAVASIAPEESAFWYRRKPFVIQIESWWNYPESDLEDCRSKRFWQQSYIDWVRNFRYALWDAGLIEGAFINFFDRDLGLGEYYGRNLERLSEAKAKWDPSNFFLFEMSIPLK